MAPKSASPTSKPAAAPKKPAASTKAAASTKTATTAKPATAAKPTAGAKKPATTAKPATAAKPAATTKPTTKPTDTAEPTPAPAEPPPPPVEGKCRVRYNHYNSEFTLLDGRLRWSDVDESYCISYVFEGAFRPRVKEAGADAAPLDRDADGAFAPLSDGAAYELIIEEDEAAEAAATAADPRRAAGVRAAEPVPGAPNAASARLTAELKTLSVEELAGQSERYQQLKEARDLEDVLFSG